MENDNKIIKNIRNLDYLDNSLNEVIVREEITLDETPENIEFAIVRDARVDVFELPYNEDNMKSIDDFQKEIKIKEEEKIIELMKEKEQENVIDEPIDLTKNEDMIDFMDDIERRVSYKRTFGITESRKHQIEKISTIGAIVLFGLCCLLYLYINLFVES